MTKVPERVDPIAAELCRLCEHAVSRLPATGAGLSVMTMEVQLTLLAAADPVSERLEELQFVLGEGPCVDAIAAGRPVLVPDLATAGPTRWPVYAEAVLGAGMKAVFAFPLQVGAARLGVIDFFRTAPGQLSGEELKQAFAFADEAVMILLDGGIGGDVQPIAGPAELFQAQGMVMVQLGGSLAEAMARIRAHAYAENRRLSDVAHDIVERTLRFDRDG